MDIGKSFGFVFEDQDWVVKILIAAAILCVGILFSWVLLIPMILAFALLAGYGVEHRRTRPYYPQTNGKVEAMIKTLERELLRGLGWRKGASGGWRWSEIEAEIGAFQGWYNFYRAHGALGYRVPAALYAGLALEKQGLSNIFGLLAESALVVEALPVITQANRLDRLSLALVA